MKVTALATAMVIVASAAFAGNIEPLVVDAPEVVVEPVASGSNALLWIVPIVALAAIIVAASD